ncbi:MAG: hypothetical protein U1C33_02155, partial [Candidatus Cloacimonadaceae bacterium]|nr:hypothetical protein [Candidatus Cloacimonadaceae bacterium]
MARIHLYQDRLAEYNAHLQQMQDIIAKAAPHRSYHLVLMQLAHHRHSGDWSHISSLALVRDSYPFQARLQILSYKIQAEAYHRQTNPESVKALTRHFKQAMRRLDRSSQPQLASHAAYSLAYYYFVHQDIKKAENYLAIAKRIDYAYSLFGSLAYDLWLEAQLAIKA